MSLTKVLGENKKKIRIGGKEITVIPMTVGSLPIVIEKRKVVMSLFGGNLMEALTNNFDDMLELLCGISGQEKEFVNQLQLPELIDLVEAVVEMNKEGFFLLKDKIQKLSKTEPEKKQPSQTGPKQSNSSYKKDINSKESRATL